MAERRMFTKKITDSDAFIEMSSAAQALYFHLNQGADDDGFNNQVQMAMWKAHASIDDLKVLMAKNFIIRFENGVIVIKHWKLHNTIRKDRYTETNYKDELSLLGIKEDGVYTLNQNLVAKRLPNGCQTVAKRLPQVSIGKESKGEGSVVESSVVPDTATTTTNGDNPVDNSEGDVMRCIGGKLGKGVIYLTDNQYGDLLDRLGFDAFNRYVERLADFIINKKAHVKSHYDTILKWVAEDSKVGN